MQVLIKNEVPREPAVPELNDESVALLSELCFKSDDQKDTVDLIFVFSSNHGAKHLASVVEELLKNKISNKVFITGGIPSYTDTYQTTIPESELVLRHINRDDYSEVKFFREDVSRNTLENVTEALKVLDFSAYSKILFLFKMHAAGRGYLTLRKYVSPQTVLLQKTWAPLYYECETEFTKENWFKYESGRKRVWGEFLRIKKYGERGDIAYPEEVRNIVAKITDLEQSSLRSMH